MIRHTRWILQSSYQAEVHVSLAEQSGSFAIRSEHHFHRTEMFRMTLRRHLYEVLWPQLEGSQARFPSDGRCPAATDCSLGLYIGYVDLRKDYGSNPLAFGVLGVPRKLAFDPDSHVITGNYSTLFGGPAFACSIYSMQDELTAGAACARRA